MRATTLASSRNSCGAGPTSR
jgi:hypothetical protein